MIQRESHESFFALISGRVMLKLNYNISHNYAKSFIQSRFFVDCLVSGDCPRVGGLGDVRRIPVAN